MALLYSLEATGPQGPLGSGWAWQGGSSHGDCCIESMHGCRCSVVTGMQRHCSPHAELQNKGVYKGTCVVLVGSPGHSGITVRVVSGQAPGPAGYPGQGQTHPCSERLVHSPKMRMSSPVCSEASRVPSIQSSPTHVFQGQCGTLDRVQAARSGSNAGEIPGRESAWGQWHDAVLWSLFGPGPSTVPWMPGSLNQVLPGWHSSLNVRWPHQGTWKPGASPQMTGVEDGMHAGWPSTVLWTISTAAGPGST